MRIAQLAPLAESVTPKLYGGTERVVSWLSDELRRNGCFGLGRLCTVAYGFLRRPANTSKAATREHPADA